MRIYFKKKYFLYFFFLFFNTNHAQLEALLIDGEGWAKGEFVEIGINSKGVYGAQTLNKPITFHDNRENDGNNIFGFIANPLADDWVDYDGDFFTPGLPEEGFSIEIGGFNFNNNNDQNLFQIPGEVNGVTVLSSDCFEDTAQISWEGNIQGLNIKRYYSVTVNGLFIQMTTVIKNVSTQTKEDVYFMHNVDPDNNITLSRFYETDMSLISQASSPTDNICLVTASQDPLGIPEDMDGSHVSFYARNENARVTYGGFSNRSASDVWNGRGLINAEGASTAFVDEAISISFKLGDINPNETIKFTYYYILKEVDESFIPFIINAFQENPSICNGDDGKITFSGLNTGEAYAISYYDDSVLVPEQTFIANDEGEVTLENLDSGIYSNITINFSGCETFVDTIYELSDPEFPNYFFTKEDLIDCDEIDGVITIHGLTPYTSYNLLFSINGIPIDPVDIIANIDGEIIFSGLDRGVYADFILEQYECVTPSNEIIEIIGPEIPIANPIPNQFYCDEDYDYLISIDLSTLDNFVLGSDNPSDFEITYHETEIDVLNNITVSKINYPTTGLATYGLYAKKRDVVYSCTDYIPFNITIDLPPDFEIEDALLCLNSDDTTNFEYILPVLKTNLSNLDHNFEWYLDGNLISGEALNNLTVSAVGNYTVKATISATGCSITKQATIYPSGPPQTLEVNIVSLPFSENHTVEINAIGHGDYVFSLDDGDSQTSPIFSGISPGYHKFHIIDVNGCGIVTIEKIIIDYMKFFTPNNDGIKDYWQIYGISELINPIIFIFDRYGKLLKQLNPDSVGWDGTFNGGKMPVSDYWFSITFDDDDNIRREFKEHFTLKR